MKKILFYATAVAMVLAMAMPVQAQITRKDKKAAKKAAWDARQQFIRDSTERANKAKLDAMDRNIQNSAADKEKERENQAKQEAQDAARKPQMVSGRQRVDKPCYYESLDKAGEYMAGLGISAPREFERDAKQEANDVAINDIVSRFIGIIKSGTQYYSQSGKTAQGKKIDESNLQRLTTNIVSIQVNKYAHSVCYESQYDTEKDLYIYYIAIHVPEDALVNSVASTLEKEGLLEDAAKFKEQIYDEINNN